MKTAPLKRALPPVNFAGGLRSSPVCGLSECTMPVLGPRRRCCRRRGRRRPPPPPPPAPRPRPPHPAPRGGASGAGRNPAGAPPAGGGVPGAPVGGAAAQARRTALSAPTASPCRRAERRRTRDRDRAAGTRGQRPFRGAAQPRFPEHAIEVVVDRVDRVGRSAEIGERLEALIRNDVRQQHRAG